ncbi:N-formimino-L-glutamate deiminase [Agrobacterium tumefaciens 5A]|nr:N-formimino-L-glutamate deiminase [Agrobacterium tumefaciens 5A]
MAERRGTTDDSFWSWRNVMYQFALTMNPEDVEAVAAQLYMEMLENGFSRVGEFHYLHHAIDGGEYSNVAEMAERIATAAIETGINLTLLPVFYAHSGFGGLPPVDGQRRFINSLDSFARLLDACRAMISTVPGFRLGVAPHSLRAVTPEELSAVVAMVEHGPVHIHIAEQQKEVADCLQWSSARPVEWLLDNAPIDARWCMIHATHMTKTETIGLARSGAVAGLCPITEANLGDGIFNGSLFIKEGGAIGVGSDSNVSISVAGELRQLEYSQRLALNARNVIASVNTSTSHGLFTAALAGGNTALQGTSGIAAGNPANLFSLDDTAAPYLSGFELLDHFIFADGVKIDSHWVNGKKQVVGGKHVDRERISKRFLQTMSRLLGR